MRDEKRTKYNALAKNEYLSKLLFVVVVLLLFHSVRTVHYDFSFSYSLLYVMTKKGSEDDCGTQLNRLDKVLTTNYENSFTL